MHLLFVLVLFLMAGFKANAMEEKEREVKTISDISWFCAQLAKKVSEQPLFNGTGSIVEKCKVLPLSNLNDAAICGILTDNARKILGNKKAWHVHSVGWGNNQLWTSSRECIGYGISLWLYDNVDACSLETLEKTYKNIITLSQLDWKSARLEDHPTIMFKEDPEYWNLFIKKQNVSQENHLIGWVCGKFNLLDKISCHDKWLKTPKVDYELRDEIYLWVKKDAQEKFDEIFGFKYQ